MSSMEYLSDILASWNAYFDNENTYRGLNTYYIVICPNGHRMRKTGYSIKRGQQCKRCVAKESNKKSQMVRSSFAESEFKTRLSWVNAIPQWNEWKGVHVPHKVICNNNHICYPRPSSIIHHNQGVCIICSGKDTNEAEKRFILALSNINSYPGWKVWNGVTYKYAIICEKGHTYFKIPSSVYMGHGHCPICKGYSWDIFYVVHNPIDNEIKLGITSNDPNPRIKVHISNGFTILSVLIYNVDAREFETSILEFLKMNGFNPSNGKEYFSDEVLPILLNEINEYGLENSAK